MRSIPLALLVLLGWVGGAMPAEQIILIHDHPGCKTKTTVFEFLHVPDLAQQEERKVLGEPVDWKITVGEDRVLTDDSGMAWELYRGKPIAEKTGTLKGWFLTSDEGRRFFLTDQGSLYAPAEPRCRPRGMANLVPPLQFSYPRR
jgi:hypothetical protein